MDKVSIIVPIYNVEKYLGVLLDSIAAQTYGNIEAVLVDDGSPDGSGAICDRYAASDDRFRVIHKKNEGVGAARNDGFATADGKWVIFCDSDDWLETDAIENLVKAAEESDADISFGDANLVYGSNVISNPLYSKSFVAEDRETIDKLIAAVFSRGYCFDPPAEGPGNGGYGGPWNKLVKRSLMTDNGILFDTRVKGNFDDILFIAHTFANAGRIAYINRPVYNYRQILDSIAHSTAYKEGILDINRAIFNSWDEFMEAYGKDGRYMGPYYANVIRRLKSSLGPYFFNPDNPKSLKAQLSELKGLIASEPYASAIAGAEPDKLHNNYDRLICSAARSGSAMKIYLTYKASKVAKSIRAKRNTT